MYNLAIAYLQNLDKYIGLDSRPKLELNTPRLG